MSGPTVQRALTQGLADLHVSAPQSAARCGTGFQPEEALTGRSVPSSPFTVDGGVLTPRLRLLWLAGIVVLFALAAYPRFVRLPDQGIGGSDEFWYWANAHLWSQGHVRFFDHSIEFFRPVAFLLHAFAFTLLGSTDWAIKALHANMDLLSTGLILTATWALSGNRWLGLAVAVAYGVNSRVIEAARIELVHAPSTTFLLLTYVPLLLLLRTKTTPRPRLEVGAAFAVGLGLSLGGSLHEDLYLLVPGMALGIALPCFCGAGKRDVHLATRRILCFSAGVLAIPVSFALWLGPGRIVAMFTSVLHRAEKYHGQLGGSFRSDALPAWLAWRLDDLIESVSLLLRDTSWILAAAPVAGVFAFWRCSGNSRWICQAALLSALGYLILFSVVLSTRPLAAGQARVFFPVVFYCLPAAWALVFHAAGAVSRWGRATVIVFAVAGAALEVRGSAPYLEWLENPDNVSRLRWLQDTLDTHLDSQNRLLVTPTIAQTYGRFGLVNAVYLGDRMVHLREAGAAADSFDAVLSTERIRYVFVSELYDLRLLSAERRAKCQLARDAIVLRRPPVVLGRPFGMNRETYSVDKEVALILEVLGTRGAAVFAHSRHGTVYALPAAGHDENHHRLSAPCTEGTVSTTELRARSAHGAERRDSIGADAEGL